MLISDILYEQDQEVTQAQLDALEKVLDRVFAQVGIDVEFTRHFLDRVNDERNRRQITIKELGLLFKKEFIKHGKPIAKMGPDAEAVMKDMETDINLPFALRWDANNNELDLIAKTVMRKPDFRTSNKTFTVEGYKLQLERGTDMDVLHITDTATGRRTEVRGKPNYETNYDADDKLHQLLDRIGKASNISDLVNGEVVGINPKHPDGARAKKHADTAFNENFADGKVKGKSRPGRVKRAGASCKGSVTDLRAKAKKYSGERGKMYHWCANMKAGKKK